MSPIVIVGSGLAGYTLLKEIRKRDAGIPITLVTADDGAFYSKPNLSNAFATGRTAAALVSADAEKMAAEQKATVLTHTRVTAIDPARQRIRTGTGVLEYGKLVLALGADPFAHGLTGDGAADVLTVNNLADYANFRAALEGKRRVAILGGGLIGCEFANDLAHAGFEVDVVHLGDWPLERLLPVEAGRRLADALAALGVTWHFGRTGRSVDRSGSGYTLTLDNGETIAADVVQSAIGLKPRTQLAQAAGIQTGRGIQTNALLETSAPAVYAMGDCAEVEGQNLPYVQPLLLQARALAATLTGTPTPVVYPPMPVMVKTPAHPVVVLPPRIGTAGRWQVESHEGGVCARFLDEAGRLRGFALTGSETARRNTLLKELAP